MYMYKITNYGGNFILELNLNSNLYRHIIFEGSCNHDIDIFQVLKLLYVTLISNTEVRATSKLYPKSLHEH